MDYTLLEVTGAACIAMLGLCAVLGLRSRRVRLAHERGDYPNG